MISAIIILVLLGLMDLMLFLACFELEREEEEREKRRGRPYCDADMADTICYTHNNGKNCIECKHQYELCKELEKRIKQ